MTTHKIVIESTDGRFVGHEVVVADGVASIDGFSFDVVTITASRIIGPNYSVSYQEQ